MFKKYISSSLLRIYSNTIICDYSWGCWWYLELFRANFKTAVKGVALGTLRTLKGSFGFDVKVLLKVTLVVAAIAPWLTTIGEGYKNSKSSFFLLFLAWVDSFRLLNVKIRLFEFLPLQKRANLAQNLAQNWPKWTNPIILELQTLL